MKITRLAEIHSPIAQTVWRLSRDPGAHTPLLDVLTVDAPVNEMPTVVLHFEDFTILEREIFTTPRNHIMWARTSRVDDPLLFTVPEEFNVPVEAIRASMRKAKEAGQAQDQWRSHLPVLAHTAWCARYSLRDLVKMAAYFAYLANSITFFTQRFNAIAAALRAHVHPQLHYKMDHFLHEGAVMPGHGKYTFGSGWTAVYAQVPLMLRAQLVRHRPLHFIDNLFILLRREDPQMDLSAPVQMELCAPDTFWHSIMAKRACWISQADLWQPLTQHFNASMLPCDDGTCPYGADNQLRMQGKDPNPPCPLYLELTGQEKQPYQAAMLEYAKRAKSKWWESKCYY